VDAPLAAVTQALWRDIDVAELGALEPTARVSVILDGDGEALAAQTYPAELVEVPDGDPEGDVVIVVPSGAVPAPEFVEAHARWQHAARDVVSLGPVAPGHAEADSQLGLVRDLTRDLTDLAGGYHLAAADGTLAVSRELYEAAGGRGSAPPELWRLDLLYRLHCAGVVFAAEPGASARGPAGGLARKVARAVEAGESLELTLPEAAALVPLPPFREPGSARRHARPGIVVNLRVDAATPPDEAVATIAGALDGYLGDLDLRVQVAGDHPGHAAIAEAVAGDPRAELAGSSLADACEVPFQVTLPAAAALDPRTLGDLHELALGEEAGALHVTVPGAAPEDAMIEVVSTPAWRRAQRLGAATGDDPEALIGRLFGERWLSGVEVSTRRHGVAEPQVTEHGPLAAATDLDHERNAHLRFLERANDLAERAAALRQRTLAERLNAREERRAAERAESRLNSR
jgi:hypothetical protein